MDSDSFVTMTFFGGVGCILHSQAQVRRVRMLHFLFQTMAARYAEQAWLDPDLVEVSLGATSWWSLWTSWTSWLQLSPAQWGPVALEAEKNGLFGDGSSVEARQIAWNVLSGLVRIRASKHIIYYIYYVYIYMYYVYIYMFIMCIYIYTMYIYMYIDNYWLYKNYVVYRNCWFLIKKQHDCPVFSLVDQCVFHDALLSRLRCWNHIIQQRLKTFSEFQWMSDTVPSGPLVI